MGDGLTTGELARAAGVAPSAVRYYERRGLLAPPERRSGRRRYPAEAAGRLALIRTAQAAGFSLDEVRDLLAGLDGDGSPGERWREAAAAKARELEERIAGLEAMRALLAGLAECDCETGAECEHRALERAAATPRGSR